MGKVWRLNILRIKKMAKATFDQQEDGVSNEISIPFYQRNFAGNQYNSII
jgi:hypothetical protein